MVLLRRRYMKGSRRLRGPRRKIVCVVREWKPPEVPPPVPPVFNQVLEEATRRLEVP